MKTVCNHTLATALPKKLQSSLYVIFILFFAIQLTSCATQKSYVREWINPIDYVYESLPPKVLAPVKATINGTIKDKDGNPIDGVQIQFAGEGIGGSNATGSYSFAVEKRPNEICQIIYHKEGYNNIVRSYNTTLLDATYTIEMHKPCKCDTAIIIDNCFLYNSNYYFTGKTVTLNLEQMSELDALISCLKSHPENSITIQYNLLDANKRIAAKRIALVKKYIITNGITETRIKEQTVTDATPDAPNVQILNDYHERRYE
jgi:hypothetical protein